MKFGEARFSNGKIKQIIAKHMDSFKVQDLLEKAYTLFNNRDIEGIIMLMDPEVRWPNGWEGGYVAVRHGVRDYWQRQWLEIDPKVFPVKISQLEDGRVEVIVHQLVKDLKGNLLMDTGIRHLYTFKNGLIKNMEIEN
jgi:hypothetical protein